MKFEFKLVMKPAIEQLQKGLRGQMPLCARNLHGLPMRELTDFYGVPGFAQGRTTMMQVAIVLNGSRDSFVKC